MIDKSHIQQGAELASAEGQVLGRVEGVVGDFLSLTRPDGGRAYLPLSALAEDEGLRLTTLMRQDAAVSLLQESPEPGEPGSNALTSS
ncbi:hypothetical protein [Teichococcus cervicalis]|uniref:DUF2171 domain-containing protein n=1 Tax=Pseudoroseomonas cervicalis ATCC 49957 TaxID=525371 RepID=D5RI52_9PROT|nr:hypothetical protein [Pseudoroseomonas cervicalis]EFH13019.1 hypothetical protein HMPREF0731_0762 [Pseudoroseomonas cervicalis ATCC 49957]